MMIHKDPYRSIPILHPHGGQALLHVRMEDSRLKTSRFLPWMFGGHHQQQAPVHAWSDAATLLWRVGRIRQTSRAQVAKIDGDDVLIHRKNPVPLEKIPHPSKGHDGTGLGPWRMPHSARDSARSGRPHRRKLHPRNESVPRAVRHFGILLPADGQRH